jgi:hypothetical protein
MIIASDFNNDIRVLDAAEVAIVAAGCACGGGCGGGPVVAVTLVHPGEAAPPNSTYFDSTTSGAIFITRGCLQN